MTDHEVRRGAKIYSKPVLRIYDTLVVKVSNSHAWRCPSPLMLDQYDQLIGQRHLDVGTGTGWFLEHATFPTNPSLTLMDLNKNSLHSAATRVVHAHGIDSAEIIGDVLKPLPTDIGPFDSIGLNYLLHCVPGSWVEKGVAFEHLATVLSDDGVLFGSTILGRGVEHNLGGKGLMTFYNRIGVFHNRQDDLDGLRTALQSVFEEVSVELVGVVALFQASRPRRN